MSAKSAVTRTRKAFSPVRQEIKLSHHSERRWKVGELARCRCLSSRLLSNRRRIAAGVGDGGRKSAGRTDDDFRVTSGTREAGDWTRSSGARLALWPVDSTRRLARLIDRLLRLQLIRLVIHGKFLVDFGKFWWGFGLPPNFVLIPSSVLRRSGILPVLSTTCDGATELVSVPSV